MNIEADMVGLLVSLSCACSASAGAPLWGSWSACERPLQPTEEGETFFSTSRRGSVSRWWRGRYKANLCCMCFVR